MLVILFKAVWDNVTVDTIAEAHINPTERMKWDHLKAFELVEKLSDTSDVVYSHAPAPLMVTERDFVNKRWFKKDYPEPGTYTMCVKHTTHPSKPENKKNVRGECILGGLYLKALPGNKVAMVSMSQMDLKGSIPIKMINKFAPKDVPKRIEAMAKYFKTKAAK